MTLGAADVERACREMAGDAGAKPASAVLSGGRFVDLRRQGRKSHQIYCRVKLHSTIRRFGNLDIVLTIEMTPGSQSHILSAYHPQTCTLFEISSATCDDAQPQRVCLEHITFVGMPLLFAISETAFPHALQFLVLDPASGREFRCSMKDEGIFAMIPKSQREMLSAFTEQMLRHGALGEHGSGAKGFRDFPCGAASEELGPDVVPVLRAPFAREGTEGDSSSNTDLLYAGAHALEAGG